MAERGHNHSDLDGKRPGRPKGRKPKSDILEKRAQGGRSWATSKILASLRRTRDINLQQLEVASAENRSMEVERYMKVVSGLINIIQKIEESMEDKYLSKIHIKINGIDLEDIDDPNVIPISKKKTAS